MNASKIKTPAAPKEEIKKSQQVQQSQSAQSTPKEKEKEKASKYKGDALAEAVHNSLMQLGKAETVPEVQQREIKFNQALQTYLEQSKDFKDEYVENWFVEFEDIKGITLKKIKEARVKQSKNS